MTETTRAPRVPNARLQAAIDTLSGLTIEDVASADPVVIGIFRAQLLHWQERTAPSGISDRATADRLFQQAESFATLVGRMEATLEMILEVEMRDAEPETAMERIRFLARNGLKRPPETDIRTA